VSRIIQSAATTGLAVALGFAMLLDRGLIAATLAAQWLIVVALASVMWSRRTHGPRPSLASLRLQAGRFRAFPVINLPHALLDNVQTVAVLSALTIAFGVATTGLFAFMQRIMRAPLILIASSAGQVFQQEISVAHHQGLPLRPLVIRELRSLARWGILFAIAAPLAPVAFTFVFGEAWREAGVYGLILAPWMIANLLVSPLSQLPLLLGQQRVALGYGLAYQASLLVPCAIALLGLADARTTFALQSVAACVVLAFYGRWLVGISTTP
jgi:O-antigen/teichoic acid export membrane protein